MPQRPDALKHLAPNWFASVMGLAGLSLAWGRAEPILGEMAGAGALVLAAAAALLFVALAWTLAAAPNMLLIPGTSSVAHLEENLAVADIEVPAALTEALG